jgi:site-specific recombinase XerD
MAKETNAQPAPQTWIGAVDRFRDHLVEAEKSDDTIRAYRGDLSQFAGWFQSVYEDLPKLDDVTSSTMREWKSHQVGKGHQPQTVNRRLAALQSLLRWSTTQGWTTPVQAPRSVRQEPPRPRWLSRKEELSLIRAVERERFVQDIALVKILLYAGLRIAEAASLRWDALEVSPRKGSVSVVGKGRKTRMIPLNVEARTALLKLAAGYRLGTKLAVFESREGGGLTAKSLWRRVIFWARVAKLDDCTPHTLRHTFCRRLAEKGCRLETIASLAGHESIETTRRYVEPGQEDMRLAVELLAGGED